MRRVNVLAAVLLLAASAVSAQTAPFTYVAPVQIAPYLQGLTSSSVQIRWEGPEGEHGRLEWGAAPDALDRTAVASAYPLDVTLQAEDGTPLRRTVWLQRVELAGLTPDTTYHYRVRQGLLAGGQGAETTATFRFRTPPANPRAFRFVVYGDSRSLPEDHRKVATAIRKADPAFVFNTGDMVTTGDRWVEWGAEFFAPLHPLAAEVPVWPVRGNHDGGRYLRHLLHWPGPAGCLYYCFDWGRARFVVLDGTLFASRPEMYSWLEDQLRASPRPLWKFILVHYPSFNSVSKRAYGPGFQRERLTLLCQTYGVDLVFAGHDHNYMRTVPILAYRALAGQPTTHVVAGGGGAPLYTSGRGPWQAAVQRVHHFCRVDIDGLTLTMEAVSADTGEVIDRFRLEKDFAGRIVAPADYRTTAEEVADINAIAALRRGLTAFSLPAIRAGDILPLASKVTNAFAGPVEVTVQFKGSASRWESPAPVKMVLPPRAADVAFQMTLKARRAMEDLIDAGHVEVEYVLPDGRKGLLRGEPIRVAKSGEQPGAVGEGDGE